MGYHWIPELLVMFEKRWHEAYSSALEAGDQREVQALKDIARDVPATSSVQIRIKTSEDE